MCVVDSFVPVAQGNSTCASSTRAMAFLSVDEVGEFASLMRLVVDHRGVIDFRRVARLFRVSVSVVDTIEARAAHMVGTPPMSVAVQLYARWKAAQVLQSSTDESLARSASPLVDALVVLELRLRTLPLAAFVERAAMLFASLKGRHFTALQAGQVMPGGGPDADDVDDIIGNQRLDELLRCAMQVEQGGTPLPLDCQWYSVIPACTAPLAAWEHAVPPWPTIPGWAGTAALVVPRRERGAVFSRMQWFCSAVDATAAEESAPPLHAMTPSDIEEARASMREVDARERTSAAMHEEVAGYVESAEPTCDELRRAAISEEGPAADEA